MFHLIGYSGAMACRLMFEFTDEFVATALNSSSPYSQSKVALIVQILQAALHFDAGQFAEHAPRLYGQWVRLVASDRKEIRAALQPLFDRVGRVFGVFGAPPTAANDDDNGGGDMLASSTTF